MAYNVSSAFREQLYSGESNFRAILTIDGTSIDNDQIASISISSPIIDDSKQVFYVGTFISQKITIHFKDMNNIVVKSGSDVNLSIGQYVNNEWVDVPIGKFIIDDLAEDYYKKCEINCLDYGVKFKPNIDYSPCFTDGKANVRTILEYICEKVGVELGDCPTINDEIEVGTYDSTVSGKQWVSYIAEIKGCNAKIDRTGKLTLQPLKQPSNVPINALESASFEVGDSLKISKVTFFDAIRNFTFGDDTNDTLFIRQDNPFITNGDVVNNIYHTICTDSISETGKSFDIDDADANSIDIKTIYGETSQINVEGRQMIRNSNVEDADGNRWSNYSTFDEATRTLTRSTTSTSESFITYTMNNIMEANTTYTLSCYIKQNGKVKDIEFYVYAIISGSSVGIKSKKYTDIGTSWVKKTWTFTTDSNVDYTNTSIRFDNNGSTTSGQTATLTIRDVMLEKGSVAHDYEDYVGLTLSPNHDYPQDIHNVSGDNKIIVHNSNLYNSDFRNSNGAIYFPISTVSDITEENGIFTMNAIGSDAYMWQVGTVNDYYDEIKNGQLYSIDEDVEYTVKVTNNLFTKNYVTWYDKNKMCLRYNSRNSNQFSVSLQDAPSGTKYFSLRLGYNSAVSGTTYTYSIMMVKGTTISDYVPYATYEYPINLPIENLFNKDNANVINCNINAINVSTSNNAKTLYISCNANTTYTISKVKSARFRVGTTATLPANNVATIGYIDNDNGTSITTTTSSTSKYLCVYYYLSGTDTITEQEILDSIQIEYGSKANTYTPYGITPVINNLYTSPLELGTINSSTGQNEANNNCIRSKDYIEVRPNTTYTISNNHNYQEIIYEYNSSKGFIRGVSGTNGRYVFTTSNTTYFLRTRTSMSNVQNNIHTIFKLVKGINYSIDIHNIELNKIGTYKDKIFRNNGKNLFEPTTVNNNNAILKSNCTVTFDDNGELTFIKQSGNESYFGQVKTSGNTYTDDVGVLIPVEPSTNYYFTMSNTTFNYYHITSYDIDKVSLGYNRYDASEGSYTTPSNAYYVSIRFGIKTSDVSGTYKTTIQFEKGNKTEYEPYGIGEWYLHKEIGKVVLDGSETIGINTEGFTISSGYWNMYTNNNCLSKSILYSNYYTNYTSYADLIAQTYGIGLIYNVNNLYIRNTTISNVDDFKNWLSTHNTIINYVFINPEYNKITYQPLIDQLNAYAELFEGVNHIVIEPNGETPTLDINYYKNSNFELTSVKTHNYGDFTLDAWDNIDYDLDGTHYITLNNNTIKYEMSIMGDVDAKIPTKQQQVTTNVIGGDDKTNLKIIKTNVDQLNATVDIISKQQTATETNISQLQLDVNGINTEVERIENVEINGQNGIVSQLASVQQTVNNISNMFQITGGINLIRNSAFLLTDDLWTFTDSGTNPYHTELGNSYNSALSGDTVSVAEIKLRSIDVKSKSENITDLKTDGTRYTFNFYHKQDNNMTTTIKMYSTEDNTVKAFNDIVITGQQPKTNYSVSFIPTFANYTLEIVVTSTASIGYAYIYDMMLNSGETQSWQPASDEIYSTTLSMSRLGLKVYSVGDGTITLLGSDGLLTYETTDGRTLGRLVSSRTVEGDTTRNITTQALYLTRDITIENPDKWVSTIVTINGSPHKVEYIDRGGQ